MASDSLQFSVAIVRLSPFRDVVKSITHQFLYGECRKVIDDSCIDFVFFPTENERKHHVSITGMRTHRPLADFDIVFISNSFTTELLNLPWLLHHSGLPYKSSDREKEGTKPIIIMGGSNALASQSILYDKNTAMVDALFFGEGEDQMSRIVASLMTVPKAQRRSTLASLEGKIPGLKVFAGKSDTSAESNSPELQTNCKTKKIEKAIYACSREQLANAEQYLFDSSEATTARLFIAYDCPSFCTFCFEGWERKPYREVPISQLIPAAESLRKRTGADTLEITAFNFNTHTDVTSLMRDLSKRFFQVNFMSQRADILAANPQLAHYEAASGKRQYTIGVEGISERMRSYFNKNLNEETALTAITHLLKEPIREIKLFYIISGLETEEDNNDYKQFLAKVASLHELYNSGIRILCSFGLLVRMPFTPLRYEKLLLTEEEWKPVVAMIRTTTEQAGYEFRLTYPYEEYFLSQTLALTTEKCAPVLEEMAEQGYIYDQELKSGAWDFFKTRVPITKEFCEEKNNSYSFAFDDVDTHTSSAFLYKKFCDAKSGNETPMCMGTSCSGCGSCTESQRSALGSHKINMPAQTDCDEIAALMKSKAQAKPVYIAVAIPRELKNMRSETKAAALMRLLFSQMENGVTKIMTVRDMLFGGKLFEEKLPRWYGKTLYAVYPFSNDYRAELFSQLHELNSPQNGKQISVYESMPGLAEITARIYSNDSAADVKELESTASSLLDIMHMQYTLSRKNGTSYFSIAPKSLKKHVVHSCTVKDGIITLTGTEKIDLSAVRKSGFTAELDFTLSSGQKKSEADSPESSLEIHF